MGDYVKIDALNEDALFPVYVAAPSDNARAAIIVIPEIFGVNAGIRQKCDLLAAAGYLAVAPDIFWRFAPGVEYMTPMMACGILRRLFTRSAKVCPAKARSKRSAVSDIV
ncbi:MAG: hypothetical protein RLZZ604_1478 [Pseudomonadota bacterium]